MNHKILRKSLCFAAIVVFLMECIQGCSQETITPEGSGKSSNPRVRITQISPKFIPGSTNDSFAVTCNLYDIEASSYNLHLAVRKHQTSACDAWQKDTTIQSASGYVTVIRVKAADFLTSCVIPPAILRISAGVEVEGSITVRDSAYYQWGSPSAGNTNTVSVERFRMPYVTRGVSDSIANCIIRSFNPSDSNLVRVPISFDPLRNLPSDSNFVFISDDDLIYQLNNYSQSYDSNTSINRKVFFARFQSYRLGLFGASHVGDFDYQNWSFVFKENIDSLYPAALYNDTSIANVVAVHELLHQLGRIDDWGHDFHLGWFWGAPNRCALYSGDISGLWPDRVRRGTYTGRFRICTHHAMQLRTYLGFIPELPVGQWMSASGVQVEHIFHYPLNIKNFVYGKYSMRMSLAKTEYKKFEPVIARFELVNHDSEPMAIYNLFEKSSDDPAVMIVDEKGRKKDENKGRWGFIVPWLHTVINPGDTLLISMPINNWGKEASRPIRYKPDDSVYFGEFGFFEPGQYRAYFYFNEGNIERYGSAVQSNEVSFTVIDLNDEDKKVLAMYKELQKQRDLSEIISKFPDNDFTEHVTATNLLYLYTEKISQSVLNDYNAFIQKYPNSYYLLNWQFMTPFLKSTAEFHGGQSSGINYLRNTYTSEVLSQVLSNAAFLRGIFPDFEKQK